jgi:hypothetical protein
MKSGTLHCSARPISDHRRLSLIAFLGLGEIVPEYEFVGEMTDFTEVIHLSIRVAFKCLVSFSGCVWTGSRRKSQLHLSFSSLPPSELHCGVISNRPMPQFRSPFQEMEGPRPPFRERVAERHVNLAESVDRLTSQIRSGSIHEEVHSTILGG